MSDCINTGKGQITSVLFTKRVTTTQMVKKILSMPGIDPKRGRDFQAVAAFVLKHRRLSTKQIVQKIKAEISPDVIHNAECETIFLPA